MAALLLSQSLEALWRPELNYYEDRIQILRQLETADRLDAFHVADWHIAARLSDRAELLVNAEGMAVTVSGVDERGDLEAAVGATFEVLRPRSVRSVHARVQFLIPLEERRYQEATSELAQHALGVHSDRVGLNDASYLIDGVAESDGVQFQVECGVVHPGEVPARVERIVGRIGPGPSGRGVSPSSAQLDGVDLPPVGLFLDWRWWEMDGAPPLAEDAEGLLGLLRLACTSSEALSEQIKQTRFGVDP